MFGPTMVVPVRDEVVIEMAPFTREDAIKFSIATEGDADMRRYLSRYRPGMLAVEEWFDEVESSEDRFIWGLWTTGVEREYIGNTLIGNIIADPIKQCDSGIVIAPSHWGRGIASASHRARTWYAMDQLGIVRMSSRVLMGNDASLKALIRLGYKATHIERNAKMIDGKFVHRTVVEIVNPADWSWDLWWGEDTPEDEDVESRQRASDTLEWARSNVTLLEPQGPGSVPTP